MTDPKHSGTGVVRWLGFLVLVVALGVAILYGISSGTSPGGTNSTRVECSVEVVSWRLELSPGLQDWSDLMTVADNTSRIALAPLIREMQALRRDVMAIEAPRCAAAAQRSLDSAMSASIEAYTAFMGQKSDREVTGLMERAAAQTKAFSQELDRLTRVPPTPVPVSPFRRAIERLESLIPKSELPRETFINGYDVDGVRLEEVSIWGTDGTVVARLEHGDPVTLTKTKGSDCFVTTEDGTKGSVDCYYIQ